MLSKDKTYIYVMSTNPFDCVDEEYIKVGISNNPFNRLHHVQCGNPFKVTLSLVVGGWDRHTAQSKERQVHACLSGYHVRNEWFKIYCYIQLMDKCSILECKNWIYWDGMKKEKHK